MTSRPNILLILTDQHAAHVLGFGGNAHASTPHLDRLAERSTSFEAAYCQTPLCVPSRMSFLSGKWACNCGAWDNSAVLFDQHTTLPAWLAQHGYTTAAVGKMHFRGAEQMHGFQTRPYGDLVESRFPGHQPDPPETADGRWNKHAVGRFPFSGTTAIPESMLIDNVVTSESLAWLLEQYDAEPDTPWFFMASYSRPHFPLTAPGRYIRKAMRSDLHLPSLPPGYPGVLHPHDRFIVDDFELTRFANDEQRRALVAYYACVEFVDDCIGRLLDGLAQAGALDNTYVVYTTDHGEMAGEHGLWWKRTYYDESARVPLLVSGPGLPAGVESCPVELLDLFPTFCDWAEIEPPEGLDGESLNSLLTGRPERRHKRFARSELLGEREETRFRMVRDERWKWVEFPTSPARLFDLQADPHERVDWAEDPPPDAPVDQLHTLLAQGLTWEELSVRRADDRRRTGSLEPLSQGAVQYRLSNGRIIEADAHLYPPND